ncbi:hypothetical protein Naga_100309g8 [Nannochloropsis gaditana]|uniref:Uncharacterized protein n=1 Tax=Nannochloropsis gaditana TaxID=72520 RepID=W7TLW6_9STRA|nr:hypothetical protein Naga_100309g8 [Nannochloropsis gaditana]
MVLSSPPQDPVVPSSPVRDSLLRRSLSQPAPPPPPSQTSPMLSVLDTPRCTGGGEAAVTPGKEMETDASSGRRERDKTTGGTPSTGPSNASVRTVTFAAPTPATPLSPPCPEGQAPKPKHRVGSNFKKFFRLPRLGRSPTTSPLSPPTSSLTHVPGSPQSQLPQQQQPPQQHITRPSPFPFPFRRSETKMSAAVVTSSASKELSSIPPPRRAVPSSLSSSSLSSSSSSSSPSSSSPSSSARAFSSERAIDSPTSWPSPSPELRDRLQLFTRRLSRTTNR